MSRSVVTIYARLYKSNINHVSLSMLNTLRLYARRVLRSPRYARRVLQKSSGPPHGTLDARHDVRNACSLDDIIRSWTLHC